MLIRYYIPLNSWIIIYATIERIHYLIDTIIEALLFPAQSTMLSSIHASSLPPSVNFSSRFLTSLFSSEITDLFDPNTIFP